MMDEAQTAFQKNEAQSSEPCPAESKKSGFRSWWKNFHMPLISIAAAFFLVEVFGFLFLTMVGSEELWKHLFAPAQGMENAPISKWPLIFGALWAIGLTGILRVLPRKVSRVLFGIAYFLALIYTCVQTGYFHLFREMMWISDFRYASEGSDYFSVLLSYPIAWWG